MDGGAWWAVVHGAAKSQVRLSDFNFTFTFTIEQYLDCFKFRAIVNKVTMNNSFFFFFFGMKANLYFFRIKTEGYSF